MSQHVIYHNYRSIPNMYIHYHFTHWLIHCMMYDSLMMIVLFNIPYLLLLTEYSAVKWLKVIREAGSQLQSVVVKILI